MMDDGLFDRFPCEEIYGIHNMPGFEAGHFAFRKGPTMASSNRFDIIVRGTGGHAAQPHKSVDTIVIAAQMVGALQTLISRHKNPIDVGGGERHADPRGRCLQRAARRSRDQGHGAHLQHRGARRHREQHAPHRRDAAAGARRHRRAGSSTAPTRRWSTGTRRPISPCRSPRTPSAPTRSTATSPQHGGAEDFSFYLQKVPGCYLFVGNGGGGHREETYHGMGPCELHNPNYDFNDALLPVGSTYWVRLVEAFFGRE